MQIGNITKAATFKTSLHQSYKGAQLLLLRQFFSYFHETMHFSFKPTTLPKLYSKMVIL